MLFYPPSLTAFIISGMRMDYQIFPDINILLDINIRQM